MKKILLIISCCLTYGTSLLGQCNHPDYVALSALYESTNGSDWINNTGWKDGASGVSCDPCNWNGQPWFGIRCNDNNVYSIDLGSNNLFGSIPSSIGQLNLRDLHLDDNHINGSIPSSIFNMIGLVQLDLRKNKLSGNIPDDIENLVDLDFLGLSDNNLSGSIPISIGNLERLRYLVLFNNSLNGNIPSEILNISTLVILKLNENNLSGSIPNEIINLKDLEILKLGENNLSGSIPIGISNMNNLKVLEIYSNNISGSIPTDILNSQTLSEINLNDNQISGLIPNGFSEMPNLKEIRIGRNNLSGCITDDLAAMCSNSIFFYISDNPPMPWEGDKSIICLGENQIGASCNDGNVLTISDIIQSDCTCSGIRDSDNDGIPDNLDQCPGFDDALIETGCDDLNPNTTGDRYNANCECEGFNILPLEIEFCERSKTQPALLIDVKANNWLDLSSTQFSINWNPDISSFIRVENINTSIPQFTERNIGTENVGFLNQGQLTFAWNTSFDNPVTISDGTVLFTLVFDHNLCGGNYFKTSSDPVVIEIIDKNNQELTLVDNNLFVAIEENEVDCQCILSAGDNITFSVCREGNSPVDFVSNLGPSASPNGTWTDNNGLFDLSDPTQVDLSSIPSGLYPLTYTVIENDYCTIKTANISLEIQDPPYAGFDSSFQICEGENNPIDLNVIQRVDGLGVWTSNIPNFNITDPASLDLSFLPASTVEFYYAIDRNFLCPPQMSTLIIDIIPSIQIQFADRINELCLIDLELDIIGGTAPYITMWSTEEESSSISNLQNDTYSVTVTDFSGCSKIDSFIVTNAFEVGTACDDGDANTINDTITEDCECIGEMASTECDENSHPDFAALRALYNSTNGSDWTNNSGWKEAIEDGINCDPCSGQWYGVDCENERVTCLDLDGNVNCLYQGDNGNNLTGQLNDSIRLLSELRILTLANNSISGQIPQEIGQLTNLTQLSLARNNLESNIPQEIGQLTNLEWLILDENKLSGAIPNEIGQLQSLTNLLLQNNDLSESIPSSIGSLSNLNGLYLQRNNLIGIIPPSIGSISSLEKLNLGVNKLTGTIPPEIAQLANLSLLFLVNNDLSGCIPDELMTFCNSQIDIDLSQNPKLPWQGDFLEYCNVEEQIGAPCDDGDSNTQIDIIDNQCTCGESIEQENSITFSIESASINEDQEACIEVFVSGFLNIQSVQFNMKWDPDVLSYSRVIIEQGLDMGSSNFSQVNPDKIRFSWNPFMPTTLNDGATFFTICFNPNICRNGKNASTINFESEENIVIEVLNSDQEILEFIEEVGIVDIIGDSTLGSCENPIHFGVLDQCNNSEGEWFTTDGCEESTIISNCPLEQYPIKWIKFITGPRTDEITLRPFHFASSTIFFELIEADDCSNLSNIVGCFQSDREGENVELVVSPNTSYYLAHGVIRDDGELDGLALDIIDHTFIGTACDDADPNTINDIYTNECKCEGEIIPNECDESTHPDFAALKALYESTNGSEWTNNVGWKDAIEDGMDCDPCFDWSGITCENNRVIRIDLQDNNLNGIIPPNISQLAELQTLWLNDNRLSGAIPFNIDSLFNLINLDFGNNNLSGDLPSSIYNLKSLELFRLYGNNLSGEISSQIELLENIIDIDLSSNEFSGTLPFINSTSLNAINFNDNNFSGCYPSRYRELCNINFLRLLDNPLLPWQGDVTFFCDGEEQIGATCDDENPNTIGDVIREDCTCGELLPQVCDDNSHPDFAALKALYESTNGSNWTNNTGWKEAIEDGIDCDPCNGWEGITCENGRVRDINLFNNNIVGPIPNEIGNLSSLQNFVLNTNEINGEIPSSIGNLGNLTQIGLWRNSISGSIPAEIGNLVNLRILLLGSNDLTGNIPATIGNLESAVVLDFSFNNIEGQIPEGLDRLNNLKGLILSNNRLEGTIPGALVELDSLTRIKLQNNNLSGCYDDILIQLCDLGFSDVPSERGYNFLNNAELPWQGDFSKFCNGEEQMDASCNDGDPNTMNDIITEDCICQGENLESCKEAPICVGDTLIFLENISEEYVFFASDFILNYNENCEYAMAVAGDAPGFPDGSIDARYDIINHSITIECNDLSGIDLIRFTNSNEEGCNVFTEIELLNPCEQTCRERDSLALVALYNATDGPNWTNRWNLNEPMDSWWGITLDENGCVEEFTTNPLSDCRIINGLGCGSVLPKELKGDLPDEFFKLENLKRLCLNGNNLLGSIPERFGSLKNLEILNLSHNEFTGEIPKSIGELKKLQLLDLCNNALEGNIPIEIGKLEELKNLKLGFNNITGQIPSELFNLIDLEYLNLENNKIEGTISAKVGDLINLKAALFTTNQLSGKIPEEFGVLNNLDTLWLAANSFSGCFPETLQNKCLEDIQFFTGANPLLPWQGNFSKFCDGEKQVGAPCDDGDPNTTNDKIQEDCSCGGCTLIQIALDTTICTTDTLRVEGVEFYLDNPDGRVTVLTEEGCDSTISVNLSFEECGDFCSTLSHDFLINDLPVDFTYYLCQGEEEVMVSSSLAGEENISLSGIDFTSPIGVGEHLLTVEYTGDGTCAIFDTLRISSYDTLSLFTSNSFTCDSAFVVLTVEQAIEGISSIKWSSGGDNDTIQISEVGSYAVTVTDLDGCEFISNIFVDNESIGAPCDDNDPTTDNDIIQEDCTCKGELIEEDPSAIETDLMSPNGDGNNDELRFTEDDMIPDSEIWIYNRWGDRIFHKVDYTNDWTCPNHPGGIYFYILRIGEEEIKKTLTVIK